MNKIKHKYPATVIKIAYAFWILTAAVGCNYGSQTITGEVVDESGAALGDVAVSACYSGWGWSSGSVVWDKDYCSEPILTKNDGSYVIYFKGPDVMRLRARKDGWIQTQDFNTRDSRIFLAKTEVNSARQAAETRLREENFRHRLPAESDADYYCRVILSRIQSVTLDYQGEPLSIVPSLLKYDNQSDALFAVRGSSKAAGSFANEVVFRINGQTVNGKFSISSVATTCSADIHFIAAKIPGSDLGKGERIEILVPSIGAMLDMQTWSHPVKPMPVERDIDG